MNILKRLFWFWRVYPFYIIIKNSKKLDNLRKDNVRWKSILGFENMNNYDFISKLLVGYLEYRNLVYNRMEAAGLKSRRLFKMFFPLYDTLFINTRDIGEGLFIQHGFSTIITAQHIGKNCFINQQVTIGADNPAEPLPWIGDNVRICAGAIIVGNVHIGNNALIAAGAVVVKDVNDNEVVGGTPAKFIKYR